MSASPWRPLGVPLSSWWISAFVRGSRAAPADSGVGLVTEWSLASSQRVRVRAGVCSTHHPLSHQTDLEAPAEQKQDMLHMSAHNHQAPPECTRAEQRGSATAGSRGGRTAERHGPQGAVRLPLHGQPPSFSAGLKIGKNPRVIASNRGGGTKSAPLRGDEDLYAQKDDRAKE